ncbi:sigma-70 family RNA polymerase sigma factor [Streptomyces sp. NPDC048489]|uniref:sigma-70 family RNA polymerase sigma factor n=1 Tax=Streptomyces sp. NPDC048489 TaxID=3154504 RepID=UPI00341522D1
MSRSRDRRTDSHEALIRLLYAEHGKALLAYATRMTGDRMAAEDIVQETFIRAWRHPEVIANPETSLRHWLFKVTRNLLTDRFRARSARPDEVGENEAAVVAQPDHADGVVTSIAVMAALERLTPEHRAVLVEVYYRGRTASEAGRNLGVPEGTVKSRAHHALKALRKLGISGTYTEIQSGKVAT